jgi:hypothetical protein
LAHVVALAVAVNSHHSDPALAVSVFDQSHAVPPVQWSAFASANAE